MNRILFATSLFCLITFISCNKEEITELEKRNEELIAQTSRLQKQITELTNEVNNLTVDVSNLSSNNNDLSNKIISLQNTINELEEALNNMTDDYELSVIENNELYDEYLSIVNSKNELQVQLDRLISEINEINCPPIDLASSDMITEQLFCTFEEINKIIFNWDESVYEFSFIQDSIPNGISIIKSPTSITILGTPYSDQKDLFSFDLNFQSSECEIVKRIVLARSPNSPKIIYDPDSGSLNQSLESGNSIDPIEFKYGGSAEGLSISNLPDGLTYTFNENKYTIAGEINEAGFYSFQVSTVNQGGCMELSETIYLTIEESSTPDPIQGGGGSSGGSSGGGNPPVVTPPVQTPVIQYQLTVNSDSNGSVSSLGGTYDEGTSVSITASPNNGYEFVNWTDSSGNELSTNPTYTFNITSNTTITANYEELLFYLHPNGVTILCPNAIVGSTGTVNGVQYTKVDRSSLIDKRNAGENLALVCTSGITDLNSMFRKKGNDANSLASGIGNWDTSSNTSMSRIFANGNFNQDISNWDTSNVVNMYNAFQGASSFNQDISGWDTGKVNTMRWTFRRAKRFNQDISGWDISNVDDMRGLLKDTEDFNQDLTGWNVDGVTQCDEFILNAISMTPDKIPNFTNCDPNYENPSSGSN